MYNTILFDLDGTLIDTNELIVESFRHTFQTHLELELDLETIKTFIGPTLHQTFSNYVAGDEVDAMIKTYKKHNLSNHEKYVYAYDGVLETLQTLKEMDLNLAIVTSKMEDSAMLGMKITDIDRFFDVLIGFHAVREHKPSPEGIFKAIELFDNVNGVIMIGDNKSDILAGINANVATAGVEWAFRGADSLRELNPTYMLSDLRDLIKIIKGEV